MGIPPSVAGVRSLRKMAAAQPASVFSLADGMRFVAGRGALLTALPGAGAMAVVFASKPCLAALLGEANVASNGLVLPIAADNAAHQVVSGPVPAVEHEPSVPRCLAVGKGAIGTDRPDSDPGLPDGGLGPGETVGGSSLALIRPGLCTMPT